MSLSKLYKRARKYIKEMIFRFLFRIDFSLRVLDGRNKKSMNKMINLYAEFSKRINNSVEFLLPIQYQYLHNSSLPSCAWYLSYKSGIAQITYGSSVFFHEQGVVEGVWDGEFEHLDYVNAEHVFGSGIYIRSDKVTFVSSSHMLEGVFCLYNKKNNEYNVSNSLACLFSLSNNLDPLLKDIIDAIDNGNINRMRGGVLEYNPVLFENDEFLILLFCYHNFSIDNSGLHIEPKAKINKFSNFKEYENFLHKKVISLLSNASANTRPLSQQFLPLATISSGYDSTASASVISKNGVGEAVTIGVNVYDKNDSGLMTAEILGMDCHVCQHPFGMDIDDLNIQDSFYKENLDKLGEFLATLGKGDDSSWLAFDSYLKNKIVFTGHGGDEIWFKDKFIGNGLKKVTEFELSLGEYRLQKGFVRVPLPYIGTVFANYIYRINFLSEMEAFTLFNDYDRPIPRRLAEERGIPRDAFAKIKRATNPNLVSYKKYKLDAFVKYIQQYRRVI